MTTSQQHQSSDEWTSIRIHRDTIRKLSKLGKFRETYGEVIDRIVSERLGTQPPLEEMSF
jgi:hypothetical protein